MTITQGDTYTEPGYSASDAEDGDLTGSVIVTGSVDTGTVGTYVLTYSVTDSGSLSANANRTVEVITPTVTPTPTPSGGGGGGAPVVEPFAISEVSTNSTQSTVTITWKTNRPAQSILSWGDSTEYGSGSMFEVDSKLTHSVVLSNLPAGTTFFFTINATASFGAQTSKSGSFKTLNLPEPISPPNVSNLTATPTAISQTEGSIKLNWKNPTSPLLSYIRVVRSESFFPNSPLEGTVVYEGLGETYTDIAVVTGKRYYYAVFSVSDARDYSSGVVISTIVLVPGTDTTTPPIVIPSGDIFDQIPEATNVNPIIKKLTIGDFVFVQYGRQISTQSGSVRIDAREPFSIVLDYEKVPEILKTIVVTLTDEQNADFTFLLRIDKDKKSYRADLSGLENAGDYKMDVVILDYQNQALKKIHANVAAVGELSTDAQINTQNEYGALILLASFILLLIALLVKILKKVKEKMGINRGRKVDKRSPKKGNFNVE
jgi:hypothetical protein